MNHDAWCNFMQSWSNFGKLFIMASGSFPNFSWRSFSDISDIFMPGVCIWCNDLTEVEARPKSCWTGLVCLTADRLTMIALDTSYDSLTTILVRCFSLLGILLDPWIQDGINFPIPVLRLFHRTPSPSSYPSTTYTLFYFPPSGLYLNHLQRRASD